MNLFKGIKCGAAAIALLGLMGLAGGTAQADPIVLKFSTQNAENALSTQKGIKPWLKMIEEDAQGTIKFELYASQTLAKGNQNWNAVKNGIADMAWNSMSMYNGMNPLMEAVTLPGISTDPKVLVKKLWKIYETIPAAKANYKDVKLLCVYPNDPSGSLRLVKPAKGIEDMKGRKLHSFGNAAAVAGTKGIGAVPIPMAMPDVYMALQKGTIEGGNIDWEAYPAFRMYEVAKYNFANAPMGASHFTIIMNQKKFDSLPKVAQDAILKHSGLAGSEWMVENFSGCGKDICAEMTAKGTVETVTLSDEEVARWKTALRPAWQVWADYAVKKGMAKEDVEKALAIMTED